MKTSRRTMMLGLTALAACGSAPELRPEPSEGAVLSLAGTLLKLGPEVNTGEAARAAQIAFDYTRELAIRYQITDPPLIHNTKVNMGLKPRGLCWHWAEDMEKRLNVERFETLEMHRAIAVGRGIRIDHSTAIISRKGDPFDAGVVLDPWREGGELFFAPVSEDTRYFWEERMVVLNRRQATNEEAAGLRQ